MKPRKGNSMEELRGLVEECVRREMAPGSQLPSIDEDLVESGAVDSTAWVGVTRCIEAASGHEDFGEYMIDQPRSIRAMVAALQKETDGKGQPAAAQSGRSTSTGGAAAVCGWGEATGARTVTVAELEREFGMKAAKISKGAGIESVARVENGEDEVTLAVQAAEAALAMAGTSIGEVDGLVVTSETHVGFPSLGARLHAQVRAAKQCAAVDIGGACLGVVIAFAVAQQFVASGRFQNVLLVSSDVHSRMLIPKHVKGEFGALFGDGASAFILRAAGAATQHYSVGEVTMGCDDTAAAAIRVGLNEANMMDLTFEGEALSRAALGTLEGLVKEMEQRNGLDRHAAAAFATHQPNPRLVTMLARQLGVPLEKFPPVARTCGNLGASTCGVALVRALNQATSGGAKNGPIFMASLGPGLLFGCAVVS